MRFEYRPYHVLPKFVIAALFALVACSASAMPEEAAITAQMRTQFDKPDNPLDVRPVVTSGVYAIAGWTQGSQGGRALLRKHDAQWVILLCGGEQLLNPGFLQLAGVPERDADALIRKLRQEEASLGSAHQRQMSSFEGVIEISAGKGHHHP